MSIKKLILVVMILLIISLLAPHYPFLSVWAEPKTTLQSSAPFGAEELTYFMKYNSVVTLRGVFGASDFYFNVDENWNVNSATLMLNISQSQLIYDTSLSTMIISLNGTPISTLNMKKYMADPSAISLPLNLDKIKKGVNNIKIQVYRRLSDEPCVDDVSNANWVNINENSGIIIKYNDRTPTMRISQFPYPFLKVMQNVKIDTAIVVPDNAKEGEMSSALEMASYLGKYAGTSDILFDTVFSSFLSESYKKNIIYIAQRQNMPPDLLANFPDDTDFANGAAIRLINSPYGVGRYVLIVTADNDSDLTRAIKFLGNGALVSQVDSGSHYIDRNADILTKDEPQEPSFSLSELGYNGLSVYGMFRQNANIALKIPKNRIIDETSNITINFRYSDNLDFDRSLLTVYINDIPVGSKKLLSERANNDSLTITVPKEARKGNYLNLRFSFDLMIKDVWCTMRVDELPWAYIAEDSNIYLPTSQILTNLFENFPSPFVLDNRINNVLFILPDDAVSSDLNIAAEVAAMMGHDLKSNHGLLKASFSKNNEAEFSVSNIIAIGTPERQKIIKDNNSALYYQYEPDLSYFSSNEKTELLPQYSKSLVSFQLINSVYNVKTAMLVLTSTDALKLNERIENLFQPSSFSKLLGDGILIDNANKIISHRFKKESVDKPSFWAGDIDKKTKVFALVLALAAALFLISIVLFMRKNRKFSVEKTK